MNLVRGVDGVEDVEDVEEVEDVKDLEVVGGLVFLEDLEALERCGSSTRKWAVQSWGGQQRLKGPSELISETLVAIVLLSSPTQQGLCLRAPPKLRCRTSGVQGHMCNAVFCYSCIVPFKRRE